jgi:hypothetical protein
MTASIFRPCARRVLAATLPGLVGALAVCCAASAVAQQTGNPGDIIVERKITPRDAFDVVPRSEDPVAVRATTFPATTFDPTVATLVSDLELTNAHGSSGVPTAGAAGGAAGMLAVTKILSGATTGSNVALGPNGVAPQTTGIGGTISMSVTGALAPLSTALGGLR